MPDVKLVRAQTRHAHFLYSLYDDPSILRGLGLHRAPPASFWRGLLTGLYEGWSDNFIVMQGPLPVGYVGVQDSSKDDRRGELTIAVRPEMQRKGLGEAAIRELVELGGDTAVKGGLGLHHLFASTMSDNTGSRALFEKVGFEKVAEIPNFFRFSGLVYNKIVFSKQL